MNRQMAHTARVKRELREVGVTPYGMLKFASRYLPNIIHDTEHIHAVVYGRHRDSPRLFGFREGMLVATDLRVFFISHIPGFTDVDEISYEMIAGVRRLRAGIFSAVTLHTRVVDYTLTFVNSHCATNFVTYLEKRQIEQPEPLQ